MSEQQIIMEALTTVHRGANHLSMLTGIPGDAVRRHLHQMAEDGTIKQKVQHTQTSYRKFSPNAGATKAKAR